MIKTNIQENIIAITPVILMVLLLNLGINLNIDWNFKGDSFIIIIGNLLIAVYIASVINKKHKNEELKIEACFKELITLDEYVRELRETTKIQDDSLLNRYPSLMRLTIELVSKYNFINNEDIDKLTSLMSILDSELTGDNIVNENYKNTLLQIEKRIIVTKSNILKKFN